MEATVSRLRESCKQHLFQPETRTFALALAGSDVHAPIITARHSAFHRWQRDQLRSRPTQTSEQRIWSVIASSELGHSKKVWSRSQRTRATRLHNSRQAPNARTGSGERGAPTWRLILMIGPIRPDCSRQISHDLRAMDGRGRVNTSWTSRRWAHMACCGAEAWKNRSCYAVARKVQLRRDAANDIKAAVW